jgi:putative drug exporter of the RND superfamily
MPFDTMRWMVSRHPGRVVAAWALAAIAVGLTAPDLTRLAAEGQAKLLPRNAESALAAGLVAEAWPDQSYESLAIAALYRPAGLSSADREYARKLSDHLQSDKPTPVLLRILGPDARKEIAERLVSKDRTMELLVLQLGNSFVSPASQEAIRLLQQRAAGLTPPAGLEVLWTGDAVLGRDYMNDVQRSLDRAAVATVFLLLAVLLAVYRSFWLALVPLVTIGVGLIISRGVLAWMVQAGWEISPLVELFLIVILFGCGTDFCLFLSWRFGEHWNPANPAGAMRATLRASIGALLTSAFTVIAGLTLMGTTRFKLFSSTGPSVALGLLLTLGATLTLTPALLVLLARYRPRAFAGLTAPSSGFWDEVGHRVLARPILCWSVTILVMLPAAVLGMRTAFLQDLLSEMPASRTSVTSLRQIAEKFGPGTVAPLTVVIRSSKDLRESEGLAMLDDVSRLLAHQRGLVEVRSATQPLGSPELLERARLSSRLGEVNEGFTKMAEGAAQLGKGLTEGAAKLRTAIAIEDITGASLTGPKEESPAVEPTKEAPASTGDPVYSGLRQATSALLGGSRLPLGGSAKAQAKAEEKPQEAGPRQQMLAELTRAAEGADQIAEGARRARHEVSAILGDPVGRHALDRLLITSENVRDNPELLQSFASYISPDGHLARIDVNQGYRMFSAPALSQINTLRRRLREYLDESKDLSWAHAALTGPNAEAADVQNLTQRDQYQTWIIIPLGVFLILLIALRDAWACVNLVATMILTYAFALGVTHLVFVTFLGAEGLDWKVPFFLFVLLVAVGVDYNVFLMTRLQEEAEALGLRAGINRAIAQTGGLISSAASITACSFAALLFSPLSSLRQLGLALVVGITVDAVLVRPLLVPCGQWLMYRRRERRRERVIPKTSAPAVGQLVHVAD